MPTPKRPFGLLAFNAYSKKQIPLKEITVHASIYGIIAEVTCDYLFENSFDELLEADFVFPLKSTSTVYHFEAKIGDRLFISQCRERIEAESTYRTAVENDRTAFILHEDETMSDVFTMRIGNICPRGTVSVRICYFDQLDTRTVSGDNVEKWNSVAVFSLPALITQRYAPEDCKVQRQFGPPPTFPITKGIVPYTFACSADVYSTSNLIAVISSQHKFVLSDRNEDQMFTKVRLATDFDFTSDLEMELVFADPHSLTLTYEPGSISSESAGILGMDCLAVNFLPLLPDLPGEKNEIFFLIDRSGSMEGSKMMQARRSLLILLKSLPSNCRFQIISFGSRHEALFPGPVDYTEANLTTALAYQKGMEADMGGTNVLSMLRFVYSTPLSGQGWSRQIIFLTDGDVFNQTEIISLVKEESDRSTSRFFAVGLGEGASTSLVTGTARAGRGKACFVRSAVGHSLQEAVMEILQLALQKPAEEVSLEWALEVGGQQTTVFTVPRHLAAIFNDNYFTVIGLIDNPNHKVVAGRVTLRFNVGGKAFDFTADFSSTSWLPLKGSKSSWSSLGFHRHAAKLQITELTDEYSVLAQRAGTEEERQAAMRRLQSDIVSLSTATNVLSRFTSFIGFNPDKQEHCSRRSISIPRRMARTAVDGVDSVDYCHQAAMLLNAANLSDAVKLKEAGKEEESEAEDVVVRLAEAQLFSGAWVTSADLARLIGCPFGVPNSSASSCAPEMEQLVWSTCHVLAFLQTKLSIRRTEWALMSKKAIDWLLTVLHCSRDDLSHYISAAAKIIQSELL